MAARQQCRSLINTPDLSLSDTEDSYSSDEEMPERDETDRLLRQAHHYVITEGGKDSPTTYMKRIHRINKDLVREISTHGYDCDPKLFRRVKHKIDHVLREFEDAVDADSSLYDCSDSPEYYTEGLYRAELSPTTPVGPFSRRTAKVGGKDDVERTYLYGGPGNHPEIWYKKAAASLPFPETIRMADWESLPIHWDLTNTGKTEETDPVTGNAVSLHDARLKHHDQLAQYESGSRFKLPKPSPADMTRVKQFGTVDALQRALDVVQEGDDSKSENGDYKYAPRIFLEKFDVGQQSTAPTLVDRIRSAVNTTPTRLSSSSSGSSKIGSAPPATHSILDNPQGASLSIPVDETSSPTLEDDDLPLKPSSPVGEVPQPRSTARLAAMRRVRAATEDSVRSTPSHLPQSPPAQWETQVATYIAIPKKTQCRPRKNVVSSAIVPAYQTTATGKRKRLSIDVAGDQTEGDIEYQAILSKRRRLVRESTRPCTPTLPMQPDHLLTPATLPALTPSSSVMSTPPLIKARTAGKKQRKIRTKRDFEQRVSPEKFDEIMAGRKSGASEAGHESIARRTTRSGKVRML